MRNVDEHPVVVFERSTIGGDRVLGFDMQRDDGQLRGNLRSRPDRVQHIDELTLDMRWRRANRPDVVHSIQPDVQRRVVRGELRPGRSGVQRGDEYSVDVRKWSPDRRDGVRGFDVYRRCLRRKLLRGTGGLLRHDEHALDLRQRNTDCRNGLFEVDMQCVDGCLRGDLRADGYRVRRVGQ